VFSDVVFLYSVRRVCSLYNVFSIEFVHQYVLYTCVLYKCVLYKCVLYQCVLYQRKDNVFSVKCGV
jgi:hypothetical protein